MMCYFPRAHDPELSMIANSGSRENAECGMQNETARERKEPIIFFHALPPVTSSGTPPRTAQNKPCIVCSLRIAVACPGPYHHESFPLRRPTS